MSSIFKIRVTGGRQQTPDLDQVRACLPYLTSPEHLVMVQVLPSAKFEYCAGNAPDQVIRAVQRLCEQHDPIGVYITLNPIDETTMTVSAARNDDICARHHLLIDIDRAGGTGTNASEAERDQIFAISKQVIALLVDQYRWPEPVVIDSGNGVHIDFRIDLPNDDDTKQALKLFLRALGRRFDNQAIKIDASVYDARRIRKLPGTMSCKGPASDERPHRMAKVLSAPSVADYHANLVTRDQILTATLSAEGAKPGQKSSLVVPATSNTSGQSYLQAILDRELGQLLRTPEGERHAALFRAAANFGNLVVGGYISREMAEAHLTNAADTWKGDRAADARTIRDGLDKGLLTPRVLPEQAKPTASPITAGLPVGPTSEKPTVTFYEDDTLDRLDIPPARWAVPGLLSEGLSILAGKPKLGKSWLALNLALTIANGAKALGDAQTEPGDVLYLALEDRLRRIQDRSRKVRAGLNLEATNRLVWSCEFPRMHQGGLDEIKKWIDSRSRPRLIVLDVWAKFKPPTKANGNQYEQDYEYAGALKALGDSTGISILALHHCKKAVAEDVVDEISGTHGLAGCADGMVIMSRHRGENEAKLFLTGRDIEEKEIVCKFDPVKFTWTNLGDSKTVVEGELQSKIYQFLQGNPLTFFTSAEIADCIEHNRENTRVTLYKMHKAGLIRKSGTKFGFLVHGTNDTESF